MKLDENLLAYLKGQNFDNALKIKVTNGWAPLEYSIPFLKSFCKGKRVIHIGATGHLETIERRIKKGTWLHQHLMEAAEHCVGIDINRQAVDFLKEKYGIKDLYCADILKDSLDFLGDQMWDAVLLPDVLEHIPDAHLFLKSLHAKFKDRCQTLVITVPNAFCLRNLINGFCGFEKINTDHRYWFSLYTLAKILVESHFRIIEVGYIVRGLNKKITNLEIIFKNFLYKMRPSFRETLVAVCQF